MPVRRIVGATAAGAVAVVFLAATGFAVSAAATGFAVVHGKLAYDRITAAPERHGSIGRRVRHAVGYLNRARSRDSRSKTRSEL